MKLTCDKCGDERETVFESDNAPESFECVSCLSGRDDPDSAPISEEDPSNEV
jgi:hypothetical protein